MADETRSTVTSLALIEEQADANIRRIEHNGRWFFSVIDVVGVLTDAPTPRTYWAMVKNRAQSEEFRELLTKCERLKMRSTDGKMRETGATDVETLLPYHPIHPLTQSRASQAMACPCRCGAVGYGHPSA